MNRFLLLIPLALLAVGVLWWSQRPSGPVTVSGLIEAHDIRVGSRVGGRVAEVHANEGDRVKTGDPLVTLDPYDLREKLSEAQAQLGAARAEHAKLMAGFRSEEIAQSRALRDRYQATLEKLQAGPRPLEKEILRDKLQLAQADQRKAQFDYERVKRLFDKSDATPDEMSEATRGLEAAVARVAVAEDELALADEGTRAEEIAEAKALVAQASAALELQEKGFREEEKAEAEAAVRAAESRVAAIQRQIEEVRIVAPSDAVVEAINLKPGDLIAAGAPVLTLLDPQELWVRAFVPERYSGMKLGRELSVRVDALDGRAFKGRLVFLSREAEFTPSNAQTPEERSKQVFRIKVMLDEGLDVLRAGMTADVVLDER